MATLYVCEYADDDINSAKEPPLAEQTRIVAEVERRLSVVEELEAVVSANLQRATRLRQSIFVAFRGVGVEPAERLAAASPYGAVLYGRQAA